MVKNANPSPQAIEQLLPEILTRLSNIEKALSLERYRSSAENIRDAILSERLGSLTLKRHAVLTASVAGKSYQFIANAMACDLSTVKLQLKASLTLLGIRSRSELLSGNLRLLDNIDDATYVQRYGLSKRWWLENDPDLLTFLRTTKPANNQHTAAQSGRPNSQARALRVAKAGVQVGVQTKNRIEEDQ